MKKEKCNAIMIRENENHLYFFCKMLRNLKQDYSRILVNFKSSRCYCFDFFFKKWNIYAWCGFYTVNFRRLKQMFLSKSLYHTEDIDSLKSNKKRYFTSRKNIFSSGSLKIANLVMLWTNLCPF